MCYDATQYDLSHDHQQDVFTKMNEFRTSKLLCDVQINVGTKQIPAHKLLLASSVPYFHSMFASGLIECSQEVITLQDMDEMAVEAVIDFVYTSKLCVSDDNVVSLLR